MRVYTIHDSIVGEIPVKCRYDDDCLFCKHCSHIYYGCNGVYALLCDKDFVFPIHHNCKHFEDREDGNTREVFLPPVAKSLDELRKGIGYLKENNIDVFENSKAKLQNMVAEKIFKNIKKNFAEKMTKDGLTSKFTFIDVMDNAVELKPKPKFNKLETNFIEKVEELPVDNVTKLKIEKRVKRK